MLLINVVSLAGMHCVMYQIIQEVCPQKSCNSCLSFACDLFGQMQISNPDYASRIDQGTLRTRSCLLVVL